MEKNMLDRFQEINKEKKLKLVFQLTDRGFASEINNMLSAILYCLLHDLEFILYSRSWNAFYEKGWQDYFLPFCKENKSLLFYRSSAFSLEGKSKLMDSFQKKIDNAGNQINSLMDGKVIEIAGFMVPLKTKGSSVTQFLLVPEAGQCIHVPPPPLNQTLLVEMPENPTNIRDIYIPIIVTGKVSVGSQSFDIADSGYSLTDVTVENLTFKYEDDL